MNVWSNLNVFRELSVSNSFKAEGANGKAGLSTSIRLRKGLDLG